MTRARFPRMLVGMRIARELRSPLRPTMSFSGLPSLMVSGCSFAARCLVSRHRLPSQTPLPRLNWALPLLETVVMANMTDPIVDRTVRQLDGYGLHDYVGRATPVARSRTVSCSSLLEICEAESTVPTTFLRRQTLSIELQRDHSKGDSYAHMPDHHASPLCVCPM
jgi:hypothetical protein